MFLIRPHPYEDESFGGYVIRLTEENICESPYWIYKPCGLMNKKLATNPYILLNGNFNLGIMAQMTGLNVEVLWSLLRSYRQFQGKNEDFTKEMGIHVRKTKICPICIREKNYLKNIWNLALVTVCNEHNCLLIDSCMKCHKTLTYNRNRVSDCSCGFDLSLSPVELIHREERMISTLVSDQWYGTRIEEVSQNPLGKLQIPELVKFVLFMARCANTFPSNKKFVSSKIDNKSLHTIFSKVAEIFSDWPNNFIEFLDKYRKSTTQLGGVKSEFGYFYKLLYSQFNHPEYLLTQLSHLNKKFQMLTL